MLQYNFTSASLPALKSLILFFSSETAPNSEKTVLLCSLALKQIPESESEERAPLILKMADMMKDTPRLGDYLVRKRLYESIIRDSSKPEYIANAAYELGDIELFFTRSFPTALALYNKTLENTANPTLKRLALIRIGDTYLYSGKISEAKQAYINAPPVKNDKKSENILRTAYGQYIESYMRENKYENALDALNTWEWEYPDVKLDGYSFLLRIRINYKLGKLDEVTKYAYYILNVLEEESYKPETYYILISLLLKDHKKESALPYFEKMKDAFPNHYYTKMLLPFFE